MPLLDEATLEAGGVVANCRMNRGRHLRDYDRELGFNVVAARPSRWLDIGCGEGRALIEASARLPSSELTGIDLVAAFASCPAGTRVRFVVGPVRTIEPGGAYDLRHPLIPAPG